MRALLLPLVPLALLLGASPAAAQREVVVERAQRQTSGCAVNGFTVSAAEVVAPNEPLEVRFTGPARPVPERIPVTLRGASGTARRVAELDPDDDEGPICDSAGPTRCAPHGTRPLTFGVRFAGAALAAEGEHRLDVGDAASPTCSLRIRVSAALARVHRAHRPAQSNALVAARPRTHAWELVRARLGRRTYGLARAVIGPPERALVVDIAEALDPRDRLACLDRLRRASFAAVIDASEGASEGASAARRPRPAEVGSEPLLSAVFYEEPLLFLSVSGEGFEVAWPVSEARIPGGRAIVRIRGRALGEVELEVVASYLAALHPSFPPALP